MAWWSGVLGLTLPEDHLVMNEVIKGLTQGGREHHYTVAHRVLPYLAFENPVGLIGNLGEQRKLVDLWNTVGAKLDDATQRLHPKGLSVETRFFDTKSLGAPSLLPSRKTMFSIALITFPLPRQATEAYFAAVVLGPLPEKQGQNPKVWIEAPKKAPTRYFTLELGVNDDQTGVRTVLGEWQKDNIHINLGTGPSPNLTAFYERICLELPKFI